MSPPIVPFDPARTTTGYVHVSLKDAYSDDAIRSFVELLRQLAVVSPETCQEELRSLGYHLSTRLEDISRGNHPDETNAEYALRVTARWERRRLSKSEPWTNLDERGNRLLILLRRLATVRPAVVFCLEWLAADMLELSLAEKRGTQ